MIDPDVRPLRIVIPLYQGVTQLDFTGPHQFFSRLPDTEVIVASVGAEPVSADGLVFAGLHDLGQVERCDVLCVPGGGGCTNAMASDEYMDSIRRLAQGAAFVTSVCTGSLILGAAGLLKGRRAASHWAWRDQLPAFGAIADEGRVVQDGNIITGGGVTAGIDFALTVISELFDARTAQMIQLGLEYAPQPPFDAGRPERAPAEILEEVTRRMAASMADRRSQLNMVVQRLVL
ncbi:DJ-1/PfpI family protein [Advenella mimigardefordensis]|uniref:Putative transcriptional regulator, DJ-1/PfpI family n=1 Tax=Advenella mimigardefordensis (strain DSM 17166 / LMG 22922 / DPN7) TaxID=1247726 RepID=W0PJH5_ADVMD|nr:DJ-1/PfpI family protein [Advenella mimigardefordensis]AHG65685.1 putative transcriptional regulator, DJ-1/PfpI family [Advenella mimigardefordensis DPN7]